MDEYPHIRAASAIIEREGRVLLIYEHRPDHGKTYWSLPAGKCEAGESFEDAVVREVLEETGLTVTKVGRQVLTLNCVSHLRNKRWTIHSFLVDAKGEPNPQDPDGKVMKAEFLEPHRVQEVLFQDQPYKSIGEPAATYLKDRKTAVWSYEQFADGTEKLVRNHEET